MKIILYTYIICHDMCSIPSKNNMLSIFVQFNQSHINRTDSTATPNDSLRLIGLSSGKYICLKNQNQQLQKCKQKKRKTKKKYNASFFLSNISFFPFVACFIFFCMSVRVSSNPISGYFSTRSLYFR